MQAQTEPIAMPALSAAAFTLAGSMWLGSSIGISIVSNPQSFNFFKSFTLSLVNGEAKRNELRPKRMGWSVLKWNLGRCAKKIAGGHSAAVGEGESSRDQPRQTLCTL